MVDMRRDGMSYRQIAEATGVHHSTVAEAVSSTVGNPTVEDMPTVIVGKDGKKRSAKQAKKNKPAPQHGLFAATEKQQDGYLGTLQKAKVEAPDVYEAV